MKSKAQLEQMISRVEHTATANALARDTVECVFMFPAGDPEVRLGQSRLGGFPDLPESVAWPLGDRNDGYSMFLGQLNLSELPAIAGSHLPAAGMLWLFRRQHTSDSSSSPPTVEIVYLRDCGPLAPRRLPSRRLPDFPRAVPIRFEAGLSLPLGRFPYLKAWVNEAWTAGITQSMISLYEATVPKDHVGQIGGYAFAPGENPDDLYRSIAVTTLGRREMIAADRWDDVGAYEADMENLKTRSPENWDFVKDLESLRPKVKWISEHSREIEAEASAWHLLLSLRGSAGVLDFGSYEELFIFFRTLDDTSSGFSNLRFAAEYR